MICEPSGSGDPLLLSPDLQQAVAYCDFYYRIHDVCDTSGICAGVVRQVRTASTTGGAETVSPVRYDVLEAMIAWLNFLQPLLLGTHPVTVG